MSGTEPPRPLRVALLYGGRSPEHDVSRMSARGVLQHLNRQRYAVTPIGIDRDGVWYPQSLAELDRCEARMLPLSTAAAPLSWSPWPGGARLPDGGPPDVVLPVLHGPHCEDGTLQGLFELCGVAFVGAGVLGSAASMDKDVAKRLVQGVGIAVSPYVTLHHGTWETAGQGQGALLEQAVAALGLPLFVKPAGQGSSIGIRRAADRSALAEAIEHALRFDAKVLLERSVDAREIELAVLTAASPGAPAEVSVAGEINAVDAFYDYDRKYEDAEGARLQVPAALTEEQAAEARTIAARAFDVLQCEGMARIDLFLDRNSGALLFNEANTLPGFTPISMYPRLWEASGLGYGALLDRLIDHARQRHTRRRGRSAQRA